VWSERHETFDSRPKLMPVRLSEIGQCVPADAAISSCDADAATGLLGMSEDVNLTCFLVVMNVTRFPGGSIASCTAARAISAYVTPSVASLTRSPWHFFDVGKTLDIFRCRHLLIFDSFQS
jgi:hypothetical protein